MKKAILICLLPALLQNCSEKRTVQKEVKILKDANGHTTTTTTESSAGEPLPRNASKTGQVKLHIKRNHLFSNQNKPDHFELNLYGQSLLSSNVNFSITNPEGKVIFRDSLSAADLEASMVYEMKTDKPTVAQREEFVKKRLNEFFDEKNFSMPAIAPNDSYYQTFGDEKAWNDIKKDPKSIGFNYLLGKENGRRIAYSKLLKKAMLVGNFGG